MPDTIFEEPRLVSLYDDFDGDRTDLQHYLAMAYEFKADKVLDVGCGTGCFASLLGQNGFMVYGLDPAEASLNLAKTKPFTEKVTWFLGEAASLPPLNVDLAVMTGNVAQVFLTDEEWGQTLKAIHRTLRSDGVLVFEVRDPAQMAWLEWTKKKTQKRLSIPSIGFVESWCEVTAVEKELVSFRWHYHFESDGKTLISDSTLRFRQKENLIHSLENTGYVMKEVRDAPDRPGKEWVFIARAKPVS